MESVLRAENVLLDLSSQDSTPMTIRIGDVTPWRCLRQVELSSATGHIHSADYLRRPIPVISIRF